MKIRRVAAVVGSAVVLTATSVAAVTVGIPSRGSTALQEAPLTVQQRHSMQDLLSLRQGISYDDAARTLGHVGHELLRTDLEGILNVPKDAKAYMWPNPDGSRIVLIFSKGGLAQRHQFGLR
jgi:hypothetical protein